MESTASLGVREQCSVPKNPSCTRSALAREAKGHGILAGSWAHGLVRSFFSSFFFLSFFFISKQIYNKTKFLLPGMKGFPVLGPV